MPRFLQGNGEFQRIISYCEEMAERKPHHRQTWDKYALLFEYAGNMGRRSIEATTLQLQDFIKSDLSQVKVRLAKSDKIEIFYISKYLRRKFYDYLQKYRQQIVASGGYFFFTFNPVSRSRYLSNKTVWDKLRSVCEGLGINDFTEDNGTKRYRIGMHSFRRFGASEIKKVGGLEAAQRLLGHKDMATTMVYLKPIAYDEQMVHVEEMSFRLAKPAQVFQENNNEFIEKIVKEKVSKILQNMFAGPMVQELGGE